MTEKLTAALVSAGMIAMEAARFDIALMDRIAKAIADTERVAEFKIHVCNNDCKAYVRTTWGAEINNYELREHWRLAVTKALDDLDEIKPGTVPNTDDKE